MEQSHSQIIDRNTKIFFEPKLAAWYAAEPLNAAEAITFIRQRQAFAGKRVLDIGVGSGRTTRYLLPFASSYLGVDLSPSMLERCRRDWPKAEIAELDLRDLALLNPRRFDFIVASSAVLDVLDHETRLRALADCVGLLRPNGIFYFSAHNRNYVKAGLPPSLDFAGSPMRWPVTLARYLPDHLTHFRMKRFERREADYALLNDIAHGWQAVFYYTDRDTQLRQIEGAGLSLIEVLADDGSVLEKSSDDSKSGLLHYICQKPGNAST
jgi:SAM-dependent methyltransferase